MLVTSVCLYCGSANNVAEPYKKIARETGAALAGRKLRIVYGGGHVGLMGIAADAALAAGAEVIGVLPHHLRELEYQHNGLTKLHIVPDMHSRKRMMIELSDAFVVLPGGLGTLDEAFEILTWKKLRLHTKPIVVFNHNGYWDPLLKLIDHTIGENFSQPPDRKLFEVATSIEAMFAVLERAPAPGASATERM